ncbi:hypothetical protein G4B88_008170 [Cannabis sativa]|uniref:Uncharacterized protein n=1 Tax=Cannabis sativa TaxID=3483 RepID=A0A7J6I7E2_CANSA|nr:hypothetical protein G4B88_008170 [Cannabis sativa]
MKLSTKPISSPGRTEKFPPPLMRFLRTNVGSKSRGRSRASPMFVRKKNPSSAIETQEPSSPKVTCMGQVRVRRSSKQKKPTKPRRTESAPAKVEDSVCCRCRWIPRALFCHHYCAEKFRPKLCSPVWSKWCSFFQASFRRKVVSREETSSRFWGSPLKSEKTEQEPEQVDDDDEDQDREEDCSNEEKPISKLESFESRQTEIEEKFELSQEVDESTTSNEKIVSESANTENEKVVLEEEESKTEEVAGFERPLILTRCKSEPARTGEKLDPELIFWKNTRLGIINSCSPTVCD